MQRSIYCLYIEIGLLLNLVTGKYSYLSVPCKSIICLSPWLQQILDPLSTEKSQHFAHPHPKHVINYCQIHAGESAVNHPFEQMR